jgi:hypothetical protein
MRCVIQMMLSHRAGQPRLHTETTVLTKMFHGLRGLEPVEHPLV